MKRVFISQPVEGKSDVEVLSARAKAAHEAQEHLGEEIEVLDAFWSNTGARALQMLGQAISVMSQADLVYFVPGWESDRKCSIEHTCATEYGINVLEGE